MRERCAATGRGYAAGRCYTRALLAGSVHGTDGVVLCKRWTFERWHALTDNRRLVEMLCRLQSRGGQAGRMKAYEKGSRRV